MFIKDGKRFNIYAGQAIGDVQYPAGYFLDEAARAEHGVTELPDPERKDEKYYFVQEIDEAPYIVNVAKPVEQIQGLIWEEIKAHRDDLQDNGGCLLEGKWYHTDTKSKQQQIALLLLGANIPPTLEWKTLDGTFVTMTQSLAASLFTAQVTREQTVFAVAETHKANVNAIQDVDTLASYDYTVGWPARYESSV